MKFRRRALLICLLLIGAALIAGLIKRSKTTDIPVVSDSEMDEFTINFIFDRSEQQTVPALEDLESKATEILLIEPFARKMSQNLFLSSQIWC